MSGKTNSKRRANIFNLAAAAGVFGTGLILFFKFHVVDGSHQEMFLGIEKTLWMNIHRFTAVAFLAGFLVHIWQHLKYISNIAGKFRTSLSKKSRKTSLQQVQLAAASIIVMCTGFFAWAALSGNSYKESELRHHLLDVHITIGLFLLAGLTVHIKRRLGDIFPRLKKSTGRKN